MSAPFRERLGPLGVWGHLDSLTTTEARAYAHRVEELGYGALWVPEVVGREPFTLLALLADVTAHMALGTSIAAIPARDAQTCRMAALTLQEATGGRFVLGLGVSHPHLVEKLRGHQWERPLPTMRRYLEAYRAAVYKGPSSPSGEEPPILLGALGAGMLVLSATQADGAFAYLVGSQRIASIREQLDAAARRVADGRRPLLAVSLPVALGSPSAARAASRGYLAPYLRTPAYRESWALQGLSAEDWESGASDRLIDAMVACGEVGAVRERIRAAHAAGADHVALIALDPAGGTEHLATLESLAD